MRNGCLFNHFKLFIENLELYRSLVSNALNVALLYFFYFLFLIWEFELQRFVRLGGVKNLRLIFPDHQFVSIFIHIYLQ